MTPFPASIEFAPASLRASSLEEAHAACLRFCRSHYENFPVASCRMPLDHRGPIAAVYVFARVADDFADEPAGWSDDQRLRLLNDWRDRLRRARTDHHQHPVFWALADAMKRFSLPPEPFERLITAFEMDVTKRRYPTFEDVLFYCRHSANPVGELVLRIFEEWSEQKGKWSDAVCTALQLANFWQDIAVDALKNRVYIPLEDLRTRGVSESDVLKGPVTDSLRKLMAFEVDRTWKIFREGVPLCDAAGARLRPELRAVWLGGTRILRKIERQRWDVWSKRPRLGTWDAVVISFQTLFWKRDGKGTFG